MTTILFHDYSSKNLADIRKIECISFRGENTIFFYAKSLSENDTLIRYKSKTLARKTYKMILRQIKDGKQIIDIKKISDCILESYDNEIQKELIEVRISDPKRSKIAILAGTIFATLMITMIAHS